jgi:hypothetical protein
MTCADCKHSKHEGQCMEPVMYIQLLPNRGRIIEHCNCTRTRANKSG